MAHHIKYLMFNIDNSNVDLIMTFMATSVLCHIITQVSGPLLKE